MQDTAITIARDLIDEIGQVGALRYLANEMAAARSWREVMQVTRLAKAVVLAGRT